VGVSSDNELEALITEKRKSGIYLTCLGFGQGNFKDSRMEMLADKGNGNYDYIDNINEAEKTLVKEFKSTLFTVAKDVKAQIEFNPASVQAYRLIGYENRMLNTEDFKDDKKDAGDMGAGHTVTILYEIVPAGIANDEERPTANLRYQQPQPTDAALSNEVATIKFRYKEPDDSVSKEMRHAIPGEKTAFASATENTRFAASVALFGMLLKESAYKGSGTYAQALEIAKGSKGNDAEGYRAELISLATAAKANSEKVSAR
jgi:Ca-activated chloride channel family protein